MASVTPEISATVSPSGGGTWGIGFDYSIGKGWFEIDHLYGYRSNYHSNGNGTLKITVYDANGTQINTQSDTVTLEFTKGGYSSDSLSYWKFNTKSGNCNHERVSGISTKTITVKIQTTSNAFNKYIKNKTWTYTINMPLYTNSIGHWAGGFRNSEGNNGNKTLFSLGSTYFDAWQGDSITYDQSRATTIPKGYSVSTAMGSSSWKGSWETYYMPATLTQPWGGTHMQYDYWPDTYSISYTMNGGTNSGSNPSSYNVLYGVTFANPSRTGYTFKNWTIDGTAVTGINPGANASFSSSSDLYNKLASRTTGNKTVVANWTANVYTIQYNANGGTGAPGNSSKTYDTAMTLPSTEPTRDGYDFLGWSTSSTATSATYTAGSSLSTDLSTTHGATVVLYAVWRELKVYVKVGGVWVEGSPYVNINGEWKRIVCVYVNNNGTWRPMG